MVFADPTQIYQVIMNLCTNALHAIGSYPGKISVTLKTETISQGTDIQTIFDHGDYLKISIIDTGHGIGKDKIHRIFEPYFTTKETGKGTGMGLAMASSKIIKEKYW
ncbi:MAG: HAMP domain-containing histidine kinase [Proteobacteria bacterium]|nr:HAMP domain-containing histidine kinase [Pseudomonadota bacterium]MBU1583501.1 HAMP domain-containing histidine kinase [Pseudomonadota bacterium]MBU2455573.1 HAMP domain-containing histidine kinase [Pseudomonadota bacterium]MBU2627790.1 HAMP domain-containing histidine kinase [Pseudomonadota bacterium]